VGADPFPSGLRATFAVDREVRRKVDCPTKRRSFVLQREATLPGTFACLWTVCRLER
jgi:hypothetical protein